MLTLFLIWRYWLFLKKWRGNCIDDFPVAEGTEASEKQELEPQITYFYIYLCIYLLIIIYLLIFIFNITPNMAPV